MTDYKDLKIKRAWLVTVDYKLIAMKAFTSYESSFKYYNEMVNKVEEELEGSEYEKQETYYFSNSKPVLTQFIQWNEHCKSHTTAGLVSIKEIELEDEWFKSF